MNPEAVSSALDGMTRRDLEALQEQVSKRLLSCATCGGEHPDLYNLRGSSKANDRRGKILLCTPCFERLRVVATASSE